MNKLDFTNSLSELIRMSNIYFITGFPLELEEIPKGMRFPDMIKVWLFIGWKKKYVNGPKN